MKRRIMCIPLALALALVGSVPVGAQEQADVSGSDRLRTAMSFAPADSSYLGFTDWAAIKASRGLDILDSDLLEDLRIEAMVTLSHEEALFGGYGIDSFIGHADTWGWDASDITWTADLGGAGPPVTVVRLRDGVDLSRLAELLDEREFETRAYGDAVIRSHALEPGVEWFRPTDLRLLNIALLPDGHTLLAASSAEAIEAAIDASGAPEGSLHASEAAVRLASQVGAPLSVAMEIAGDACLGYAQLDPGGGELPDVGLIAEVGTLGMWDALSLATYRDPEGAARGRLSLAFPGAEDATLEAEREARERLAREGHSSRGGAAYADAVFEVIGSETGDETVSLELLPVGGHNRAFAATVFARDLLPAMCT